MDILETHIIILQDFKNFRNCGRLEKEVFCYKYRACPLASPADVESKEKFHNNHFLLMTGGSVNRAQIHPP
jgi:hypothetical protein